MKKRVEDRVFYFAMDNTSDDVDKIITAGRLYAADDCRGTCVVNLSRSRKYVIDREDDVVNVKDGRFGYEILQISANKMMYFLKNFKLFRESSFYETQRELYYSNMAAVAR